jgi:O-antigen/teichoic acid export membrane protein
LEESTKSTVVKASTYSVISYGMSQALRFGGNLLLTRLLAPELFGLVATAQIFISGLHLLSDIGLEQSIVRSERSCEPGFLNTAWTLQILRAAILSIIAVGIAFPAAAFYKQPVLLPLICLIAVSTLISGFESTSLSLLVRDMNQKALMIIDLTIQVVSLACVIVAAYFFRNVWALLVGDIVGPVIRTIWSHSINSKRPNRLCLGKSESSELLSFGKWILISTAITFVSSQIDRLIFGKMLGMAWFGVYNIAITLAEAPKAIIATLAIKIVFPLVSKYSHLEHEELRDKILRPRGRFLLLAAAGVALLACSGDYLISVLFDQRYRAASWIFPLLVVGLWPQIMTLTIDGCLLAIGKPIYSAVANSIRFVYLAASLPIAYKLGGELAAVVAVALNGVFPYLVYAFGMKREKLSMLKQDLSMTLVLFVAIGALIAVRLVFGLGFPGQPFLAHPA